MNDFVSEGFHYKKCGHLINLSYDLIFVTGKANPGKYFADTWPQAWPTERLSKDSYQN